MKRLTSRIGLAAALALLALSRFSLVCRFLSSTNHLIVLAATGFPYASILALLALAALLCLRRWIEAALATALLLVLAFPMLKVLLTWPDPPSVPQHGTAVQVMTFNMRLGRADAADVVEKVRAHHVQLLLLQELSPSALAGVEAAGLSRVLPHSYARPGEDGVGVGVFSAWPLKDAREDAGFNLGVVSARLALPSGQQLSVFSSHLVAPWPQASLGWRVESEKLGRLLASTPGAVIDAGDFNANTSMKPFRQLLHAGGVRDAATVSGEPGIRTYPANQGFWPPLIGIDHVLLRGVDAQSARTVAIAGSDHRALVTSLVVPLA